MIRSFEKSFDYFPHISVFPQFQLLYSSMRNKMLICITEDNWIPLQKGTISAAYSVSSKWSGSAVRSEWHHKESLSYSLKIKAKNLILVESDWWIIWILLYPVSFFLVSTPSNTVVQEVSFQRLIWVEQACATATIVEITTLSMNWPFHTLIQCKRKHYSPIIDISSCIAIAAFWTQIRLLKIYQRTMGKVSGVQLTLRNEDFFKTHLS